MALDDLTGKNIQDTYKRLVQTEGNTFADGSGSVITTFNITSSHAISASYALSASHEITYELSSSHAQTADSASYVLASNIDQPFTHITSSGNISASGNTFGNIVGGQTFNIKGTGVIERNNNDIVLAGASEFTSIQIGKQTQLKPITLEGHITASGNIFASGDIRTDDNLLVRGNLYTVESGLEIYQVNTLGIGNAFPSKPSTLMVHGDIYAGLHITASGNISASGNIFVGDKIYLNNDISQDYIQYGGVGLHYKGSIKTSGTDGHITASGNIKAAGTITANEIHAETLFSHAGDANTGLQFSADTTTIQGNNLNIATFASSRIELNLPVTASGNIRAGGTVIADSVIADTGSFHVLKGDTTAATGLSVLGYIEATNITASGNISASGTIKTGEITANLYKFPNDTVRLAESAAGNAVFYGGGLEVTSGTGNITASGNISASDNIFASQYKTQGKGLGLYHVASSTVRLADQLEKTRIDGTNIELIAPVTASGNISASGYLFGNNATIANNIYLGGENRINYNNDDIRFQDTGIDVAGNITASGNISASGNLYADHIVSDTLFWAKNTSLFGTNEGDTHYFTGHVTASSNISASGDLLCNNLDIDGNIKLDNGAIIYSEYTNRGRIDLYSSNTNESLQVRLQGDGTKLDIKRNSGIDITGNITASGNISSSGNGNFYSLNVREGFSVSTGGSITTLNNLNAGNSSVNDTHTLTGKTEVRGNITASGNISSSGTIYSKTPEYFTVGGWLKSTNAANYYGPHKQGPNNSTWNKSYGTDPSGLMSRLYYNSGIIVPEDIVVTGFKATFIPNGTANSEGYTASLYVGQEVLNNQVNNPSLVLVQSEKVVGPANSGNANYMGTMVENYGSQEYHVSASSMIYPRFKWSDTSEQFVNLIVQYYRIKI